MYRPRLILEGPAGRGQTTHLGPALLHHMEHLTVHLLDLSTLFCVPSRTPEEACAHVNFKYNIVTKKKYQKIIYFYYSRDNVDLMSTKIVYNLSLSFSFSLCIGCNLNARRLVFSYRYSVRL